MGFLKDYLRNLGIVAFGISIVYAAVNLAAFLFDKGGPTISLIICILLAIGLFTAIERASR